MFQGLVHESKSIIWHSLILITPVAKMHGSMALVILYNDKFS